MEFDKNYTIDDAHNLITKLDKAENIIGINTSNLARAMEAFANVKDKKNFKKVVDKYISLAKQDSLSLKKDANPYSFLEYLCAGMDHSFTTIGYSSWKREKLEPGITQTFFRNLYRENL